MPSGAAVLFVSIKSRAAARGKFIGCSLNDVAAALPPGSSALEEYIRQIYGDCGENPTGLRAASSGWRWDSVGIVWSDALPAELRSRCDGAGVALNVSLWAGGPGSSPRDALWANEVPVHNETPNFNVGALPAADVRGGHWVEVTHTFLPGRKQEAMGVWMYQARGSGLWYWTGRRLTVSDTADLAVVLGPIGNHTLSDLRVQQQTKGSKAFKDPFLAAVLGNLVAQGYAGGPVDTIEIVRHVNVGWPTYRHELLSLGPTAGESACPPSDAMRSGLQHDRRCECANHGGGTAVRCARRCERTFRGSNGT